MQIAGLFCVFAVLCVNYGRHAQAATTVRPYKFGFNIEEQQHRSEQRDERGIIMGEFGFITADGIYHVTVYATDENGKFKILAMRNYPYVSGPAPKTIDVISVPKITTTTTLPPPPKKILPKYNFNTEACSGCFLKNGPSKSKNEPESGTQVKQIEVLRQVLPELIEHIGEVKALTGELPYALTFDNLVPQSPTPQKHSQTPTPISTPLVILKPTQTVNAVKDSEHSQVQSLTQPGNTMEETKKQYKQPQPPKEVTGHVRTSFTHAAKQSNLNYFVGKTSDAERTIQLIPSVAIGVGEIAHSEPPAGTPTNVLNNGDQLAPLDVLLNTKTDLPDTITGFTGSAATYAPLHTKVEFNVPARKSTAKLLSGVLSTDRLEGSSTPLANTDDKLSDNIEAKTVADITQPQSLDGSQTPDISTITVPSTHKVHQPQKDAIQGTISTSLTPAQHPASRISVGTLLDVPNNPQLPVPNLEQVLIQKTAGELTAHDNQNKNTNKATQHTHTGTLNATPQHTQINNPDSRELGSTPKKKTDSKTPQTQTVSKTPQTQVVSHTPQTQTEPQAPHTTTKVVAEKQPENAMTPTLTTTKTLQTKSPSAAVNPASRREAERDTLSSAAKTPTKPVIPAVTHTNDLDSGVDLRFNSKSDPNGSSGGSDGGDLYHFKYTLDYNGHEETGARNGNKVGNYFAIDDDNLERTITYVANEFGFQPHIRWRKVDAKDLPKENSLKDYEFTWFKQE